jgi:hypothetical protein
MKSFSFVLIATLVAAAPAWAFSPPYSVKLAQPVANSEVVVAGMTTFRCSDNSCLSISQPYDAGAVYTCRKLSSQVGQIVSYGSGNASFDADAIARCNQKS